MRDEYRTSIDYYIKGIGMYDYDRALAAAWLQWNRDHLDVVGTGSTTL